MSQACGAILSEFCATITFPLRNSASVRPETASAAEQPIEEPGQAFGRVFTR